MSGDVSKKYAEVIDAVIVDTALDARGSERIAKWKADVLKSRKDEVKYAIELVLMRESVRLGNAVEIADLEELVNQTYDRFVQVINEQLDK